MRVSVTTTGSDKTDKYLKNLLKQNVRNILASFGEKGVRALQQATPRDSGLAASSWGYKIEQRGSSWTLMFTNSDEEGGYPVAVMIQYGHGTGTGGYVQGINYINPAMRPIFDQLANDLWKAVKQA